MRANMEAQMRATRSISSHSPSLSVATALALGVTVAVTVAGCAESNVAAEAPRVASRPATEPADLELGEVGCSTTPPVRRAPPEFEDGDPSAVRLFYDVLAPYGAWTEDARLGLVWSPSREMVTAAFVPYATHGRWTHRSIDVGDADGRLGSELVWVSDLPWGWVTFHYGRWTFAGDRGWSWIPGRKYAGAWVDWRTPSVASGARDRTAEPVVGWGPTPPSILWRVSPGPRASRARAADAPFDVRTANLVATPYAAFATPYSYARASELFAPDLASHLLLGAAALAIAHTTEPGAPPTPQALGLRAADLPAPPALDRGLQQAWMLATPATATAVGAGPELGAPPRLRTYVAGGPRWSMR